MPERREIEIEGPNVEEAIYRGLAELGVRRDSVDIKILTEGSSGLFGLMGSSPARVRLVARDTPPASPRREPSRSAAPGRGREARRARPAAGGRSGGERGSQAALVNLACFLWPYFQADGCAVCLRHKGKDITPDNAPSPPKIPKRPLEIVIGRKGADWENFTATQGQLKAVILEERNEPTPLN